MHITGNPPWLLAVSSKKSKARRIFESSESSISHETLELMSSWDVGVDAIYCFHRRFYISICLDCAQHWLQDYCLWVREAAAAERCLAALDVAVWTASQQQLWVLWEWRVTHIPVLYTSPWMAATFGRSSISTFVLFSFGWNYCWFCWLCWFDILVHITLGIFFFFFSRIDHLCE